MPATRPTGISFEPTLRLIGATAIFAAIAVFAAPRISHGAEQSTPPAMHQQATAPSKPMAGNRAESVEERISELHAALKITPNEESRWNDVAQAMRDNAAAMEKLIAEKHETAPQNRTAVDDLKTYREFAQAHVDGLKNLTSSFESLYSAMPDGQKKLADDVFRNFWRAERPRHAAARQNG